MLRALYALADETAFRAGTLLVAAHPDDETIGAGALLAHLPSPFVVHLTDGAPRFPASWTEAWDLPPVEERARVRRAELACALDVAGVSPERRRSLGRMDQETVHDLAGLTRELAVLMDEIRPGVVLTHPYEGGSPDHDSAAFVVRATCALRERAGEAPPVALEFVSYHDGGDGSLVPEFLPSPEPVVAVALAEEDRARKGRMLSCFSTQARTLALFPAEVERFRRAPRYDFTRPPHPGTLYYERTKWETTGEAWRARATAALAELGIGR